jgi:competence protein ComEC
MSPAAGAAKPSVGLIPAHPAVAVAIPLMAGVLLHNPLPVAPGAYLCLLLALLVSAVLSFRRGMLCSLLLLAAIGTAGLTLAQLEAFYYPARHISAIASDQPRLAQVEMILDNPPRELTWPFGQYKALPPKQVALATIRRIKLASGWTDCSGEVLVQIAQPHPRLQQGQTVRAVGLLERPGPAMNPGQFDWAGYYREQRVVASIQISHADNLILMDGAAVSAFSSPLAWLRIQARRALARGFDPFDSLDHALLRALVLGDNDPELRDVQEQFRRTGTSHHLAISGMHVAVLGAVIFGICRFLRVGPRAACLAALAIVLLYGLVALPSPPVVRSIVLSLAVGIGILQRRRPNLIQLLAVSVIGMLVYHPLDLYNAGFQLSFGTVLGLMLFTRPLMEMLPGEDPDVQIANSLQRPSRFSLTLIKLRQWVRITAAAAIVAWLVSMPLVAYHFEQLNPWAILASILLAPIVFLSLIGGFAKVLLTLLFPSLASAWAQLALWPVQWMRGMVTWLASFPGADVPFPSPSIWMILLFYALLAVALIPWERPTLRWSARSTGLAGCMALAVLPVRMGLASMHAHDGELRVTLLAVGAGQCAVIEPPGAPAVLVDAGSVSISDVLRKALGPFLRHQGRRDISNIFITHANLDHFSAVAEIVDAYGADAVMTSPQFRAQSVDNPPAEAMLDVLDQLERPPRMIQDGDHIEIGGGASVDVLWPGASGKLDANNSSLVLRLNFAGRSVLFTGDLQAAGERALLASSQALHADVLVAPHHGSLETSTADFIKAIGPAYILCSNDRTLSVKQKDFDAATAGRDVYRTHTSGALTVRISAKGEVVVDRFLDPNE